MTAAAMAVHSQLTEEEGFDPTAMSTILKLINVYVELHKFPETKKSGGGSRSLLLVTPLPQY